MKLGTALEAEFLETRRSQTLQRTLSRAHCCVHPLGVTSDRGEPLLPANRSVKPRPFAASRICAKRMLNSPPFADAQSCSSSAPKRPRVRMVAEDVRRFGKSTAAELPLPANSHVSRRASPSNAAVASTMPATIATSKTKPGQSTRIGSSHGLPTRKHCGNVSGEYLCKFTDRNGTGQPSRISAISS